MHGQQHQTVPSDWRASQAIAKAPAASHAVLRQQQHGMMRHKQMGICLGSRLGRDNISAKAAHSQTMWAATYLSRVPVSFFQALSQVATLFDYLGVVQHDTPSSLHAKHVGHQRHHGVTISQSPHPQTLSASPKKFFHSA